MSNAGIRIMLTLGLLALVLGTSPARAETYIVEPITDSAATPSGEQGFSQAELDQMLAPVALYPDALLSQVLIAATYPLEIVEAARWSRQNQGLSGEDAVAAVAGREWDPSVKSLVAFPDLLARMDEDLDWTRSLGDAMLFQETQVMDSIQFLRARADAAGSLESTEYVKVIRDEKTIVIEPTRTRVVHVPYYDPHVVYGTWWWPAYRPVVWAPPAYHYGYGGYPGYYWGTGIHISTGFFYSSFYWPQRSVVIINTPRYYTPPRHWHSRPYYKHYKNYAYTPGQRWKHNPVHRRGVAYRQPEVRDRYVRYSPGSKSVSTGTFSGPQRSSREGAAGNRSGRDDRSGREWNRDAQRNTSRNTSRNPVALPEDRSRTERTEQRFTQRGATPNAAARTLDDRSAAPSQDARSQQGVRPDARNLERRLGTSRRPDARSATSRSSSQVARPQAARPQASQRSAPAVRSPQVRQRATVPTRTPQATRAPATQRATAPNRTPRVTRPQATQRTAPTRQASPPPAAQRSAPAPAPRAAPRSNRSDSRGSSRRNDGTRESRGRR